MPKKLKRLTRAQKIILSKTPSSSEQPKPSFKMGATDRDLLAMEAHGLLQKYVLGGVISYNRTEAGDLFISNQANKEHTNG